MNTNTVVPYDSIDPYNRFRDTADPCSNNHKQNTESVAAWKITLKNLFKAQREVFEIYRKAWPANVTPKEVAALLGKPLHAVSGRCSGGKQEGILVATDEIRSGSRALVLSEEWAYHLGLL